ncbi:MAG: hypothetical protein GDA35_03960, partial [Hyphomonadaceae bacterium]|nr:hypothetical protein [Hyphomonadaceae bacterium]
MNNFLRTVLAGLVLASTIGLAPDALSQSRDTRFEPTEISVRPGQARRVVVRYYRVGFIFCDKGEISSFRHGQDRIATYTAPDNPAGATDECRLFIGQRLYATLRVNLDSTAPVLEFSPSALEDVVAGASVPLTVTATDNVDGAVTPAVTCRSGSFDPVTSTYTAPLVTDIGASDPPWIRAFTRCTATAADAAGNRVEAILDVTVVPDGTPPDVTFTPATLDLSGATVPVTLTVSDNVGVTRLRVTCTQGSFDPDTNTYTAPDVSVGTAATCTATASDTAGNEREATLEITFEDTTAPVPVFSPSTLTVASGGTAVSTLTATDNVGVTTGPAVTCTQGSFNLEGNTVTYTAPDVSVNTVATCTATASDAAGNAGTATLTVSIVREATPPVVTFTPATLDNVAPGATVPVTLTATDNVGVTRVRVTCTQGSFDLDTNTYTAPDSSYNIKATCTATAMDSAGNEGTAVLGVTFPDTRAPAPVFGPSEITVSPGETAAVLFTVGDNVGVTEGPTVTCDQGSFNLEDNTFTYTAPVVSVDTMATCTATASDAAGNEGTATLAVSISTRIPDAEPPVMSFSLAVLAVDSGGTAPVTLTATDNVGVTEGPTVTCVRGSFADNTYTAPVVSADTAATCTATARDAAGNEGEAILRVFIVAPEDETPPSEALTADSDETPPVLTFSPDILTVVSGATAALTVTATDNVGVVRGPVVVCHPGTFSARDSTYTAPAVKTAIRVPCTATATDA